MSDKIEINVKVNGVEVPLSDISDETLLKIKSSEAKVKADLVETFAPVFSVQGDRLIIKLNASLRRTLRSALDSDVVYFSLHANGKLGSLNVGKDWKRACAFYGGEPKDIFKE